MIEWKKVEETNENPKMIELYLDQAWQNGFLLCVSGRATTT
jgi:hypothetical protein